MGREIIQCPNALLSGAHRPNVVAIGLKAGEYAAVAHVDDPRSVRVTGITRRRPVDVGLHIAEAQAIQRGGVVREVVVGKAAQLFVIRQLPVSKKAET